MSVEKKYKNKMGMFDFIKGIAIFAVLYWHTLEMWEGEPGFDALIGLNGFFGACWMPAFLLSSAYWYKPKDVKTYTVNQLKSLFVPYIRLQVMIWICFCIAHYMKWGYFLDTLKGVKHVMYGSVSGNMNEFYIGGTCICGIGPMWFIITLCFSGILFNMIMKQEKIKHKWIPIVILAMIGVLFGNVKVQPYCFSAVLAGVLPLYVGYRLKESKFLIRKWTAKDYFFIWLIGFICYAFVGFTLMNGFYNNAVYVVFGIPMGIVALRFGLWVGQKDNKFVMFFKKLGRYTFWILMVHTLEIMSIDWHWFKNWHVLAGLSPFLSFFIVLVIRLCLVTCGCLALSKVNKYYTRWKENGANKRIIKSKQ